jgi:phage/plasmid-associated DNA primase
MIKKYLEYIKEEKEEKDFSGKYQELKDKVKSFIQDTVDEEKQYDSVDSFIDSYVKKEDIDIRGLIKQDDLYQFYLDWRNDIDEILNSINFFDEVPSKLNSIGLYDYIITGTKKAISEVVRMI